MNQSIGSWQSKGIYGVNSRLCPCYGTHNAIPGVQIGQRLQRHICFESGTLLTGPQGLGLPFDTRLLQHLYWRLFIRIEAQRGLCITMLCTMCACRIGFSALPRSQPKTLHTQDKSFRLHWSSPRSQLVRSDVTDKKSSHRQWIRVVNICCAFPIVSRSQVGIHV